MTYQITLLSDLKASHLLQVFSNASSCTAVLLCSNW